MKLNVSKDTMLLATKCIDSFSCLQGRLDCICTIDDCSDGNIHFILSERKNEQCGYRTPFGYSFTCNCPVRKEIYNIYNV